VLRTIFAKLYRRLPLVRECQEIRNSLSRIEETLKTGQWIRMLDFELRDHPRYGDPLRLLCYQSQVCSQNGEDGILHEIFRRIGTAAKIFVEVGVGDGRENNTAFLLSQGWTGFWVDGCSDFLNLLKNREDLQEDCLKYFVGVVSGENVGGIFEQLGVPKEFDLLSLDIVESQNL
jgi:hypothetical protein